MSAFFRAVVAGSVLLLALATPAAADIASVARCQKKIATAGADFAKHVIVTTLKCTEEVAECQAQCDAGVFGPSCDDSGPPCCDSDDRGSNQTFADCMTDADAYCADQDIKIAFTGLRPGEKLHEEVHNEAEHALATSNEKILILSGVERLTDAEAAPLARLEQAVVHGDASGALQALRTLVPEYVPARGGDEREEKREESRIVPLVGKRRIDAQN